MNNIEKAIADLGDRDAVHRFIDRLPNDAKVLIIADFKGGARYNTLGNPTSEHLLWIIEYFKHFLMFGDDE